MSAEENQGGFREILLDARDGVAMITLNRPERLNAYTPTMGRELHEAFAACDADDAVRAIVVTGAGRGFCAGADLARGGGSFDRTAEADYEGGGAPADQPWQKPRRAVAAWDVRKPIIAATASNNRPALEVTGECIPATSIRSSIFSELSEKCWIGIRSRRSKASPPRIS